MFLLALEPFKRIGTTQSQTSINHSFIVVSDGTNNTPNTLLSELDHGPNNIRNLQSVNPFPLETKLYSG